jgi:hypothetical protein
MDFAAAVAPPAVAVAVAMAASSSAVAASSSAVAAAHPEAGKNNSPTPLHVSLLLLATRSAGHSPCLIVASFIREAEITLLS